MNHIDTERMHDLIDGAVSPPDRAADDAHLEACATCRSEYRRIEDVVVALGALPAEAQVPDTVWAAVAERMTPTLLDRESVEVGGGDRDADVLPLQSTRRVRTFAFSAPQLAAAAVVISLLSAGTVWMATAGGSRSEPVAASTSRLEPAGSAARMAASGDAAYQSAVFELQDLVEANRNLMAPETREALDRSLQTIDEAMTEIRQALESDPNSELLARLLANQQRSKLRILRQAATAVQARS